MNPSDAVRQQVIRPQSVSSGSATAYVVDTAGYDYAEFEFDFGAGPTSNALTVLKLQEADAKTDANTLTSGADVPGCKVGTSYTLAAPSDTPCAAGGTATTAAGVYPETQQYPITTLAAVVDNSIVLMNVELKNRKRYLLPTVTVGGVTLMACTVRLSRGDVAPKYPSQQLPANGGSAAAGTVCNCPPYCPTAAGA